MARAKMKPWTVDEKMMLTNLLKFGHTVNYVARRLDRTPRAVCAMAFKLGVPTRWKKGEEL